MLRKFDLFPKLDKQYRVGTSLGGTLSVLSILVTIFLFYTEISTYLHPPQRQRLIVGSNIATASDGKTISALQQPKLHVSLDIVFPKIPCYFLHFEVIDPVTETFMRLDQTDSKFFRIPENEKNLNKTLGTIDPNSFYQSEETKTCGNCYLTGKTASDNKECCNTCLSVFNYHQKLGLPQPLMKDVKQCEEIWKNIESMKGEGCHATAEFQALRIPSEFRVSPGYSWGSSDINFHDVSPFGLSFNDLNLSHTIKHLKFSTNSGTYPLDGSEAIQTKSKSYRFIYNVDVLDDNYTATTYQITDPFGYSPGFVVHYDVSPVSGEIYWDREPILHLCTRLLTVVGAVLAAFRAIDKAIFTVRHQEVNEEILITPSNVK